MCLFVIDFKIEKPIRKFNFDPRNFPIHISSQKKIKRSYIVEFHLYQNLNSIGKWHYKSCSISFITLLRSLIDRNQMSVWDFPKLDCNNPFEVFKLQSELFIDTSSFIFSSENGFLQKFHYEFCTCVLLYCYTLLCHVRFYLSRKSLQNSVQENRDKSFILNSIFFFIFRKPSQNKRHLI